MFPVFSPQFYYSHNRADEDVIVQGYLIPSGTVVMANLWAVHMDPDLWEAPEEFRPERFLSKDGSRLIDKPDWLVPFSVGRYLDHARPSKLQQPTE